MKLIYVNNNSYRGYAFDNDKSAWFSFAGFVRISYDRNDIRKEDRVIYDNFSYPDGISFIIDPR